MTGAARGGAGRFAPSPTGPLHLGSLLAATASYLDAKHLGLPWRVRLDDLDELRNEAGAARAILHSLERHALHWDGPVVRQSDNLPLYAEALAALEKAGSIYYCRCSRKDLGSARVYPGTCRSCMQPRRNAAVRIRVGDAVITFDDLVRGQETRKLAEQTGDFVVRRRDGIFAYHLATAVDDGAGDITRVVRGRDLLDLTGPQIFLMRELGLSVPVYGHLPLLRNSAGQKLSKQNRATPLEDARAAQNLVTVLQVLGMDPGDAAGTSDCETLLADAVRRFSIGTVSKHDGFVTMTGHDPGTHPRA